jgi:HSP20 family protein
MANPSEKPKPKEPQAERKEPSRTGETPPVPYRPGTTALYPSGLEPFRQLRQEFDRLFDQFFPRWPTAWEGGGRDWRWGLDVEEKEDRVVVRAEAPGFEPADFDLQVRGEQLVVRAAHKAEAEDKDRGAHEWRRQEFFRSVPLPPGVDPKKVEANYRQGVLTVTLPRTEESKPHRITVQG